MKIKIRLIRETEGSYTFWKVQQYFWLLGWSNVHYCDAVTCDKQKAKNLFDRLQRGEGRTVEVIEEGRV